MSEEAKACPRCGKPCNWREHRTMPYRCEDCILMFGISADGLINVAATVSNWGKPGYGPDVEESTERIANHFKKQGK